MTTTWLFRSALAGALCLLLLGIGNALAPMGITLQSIQGLPSAGERPAVCLDPGWSTGLLLGDSLFVLLTLAVFLFLALHLRLTGPILLLLAVAAAAKAVSDLGENLLFLGGAADCALPKDDLALLSIVKRASGSLAALLLLPFYPVRDWRGWLVRLALLASVLGGLASFFWSPAAAGLAAGYFFLFVALALDLRADRALHR